jgi:hypothetical protein
VPLGKADGLEADVDREVGVEVECNLSVVVVRDAPVIILHIVHEDYLDVEIERRDRRAIEEATAGEGRGRGSWDWGIASGRARERA